MLKDEDLGVYIHAEGVRGYIGDMERADGVNRKVDKNLTTMGRTVRNVGLAVGAAAVAGVAGFTRMARSAGEMAVEIKNLSNLAGVAPEEFQRLAAGAREVGIEQEKVADIFKDVSDKFGDFLTTGAGPLKDFFEQVAPAVGVTADQFAKLSGPEALQLYVDSLEKAGASQQQMTFFMEALASDATALLPLLRNGGAEMRRFGEEAETAGRIMSNDLIANGVELEREFRAMSNTLRQRVMTVMLDYSDEILNVANFISDDLIPAVVGFIQTIGGFVEALQPAIGALQSFLSLARAAAGIEVGPGAEYSDEDAARIGKDIELSRAERELEPSNTGAFFVDNNGEVQEFGANTPSIPGITAPAVGLSDSKILPPSGGRSSGGSSRGGGGAGSDRSGRDLDRLRQEYAEEAELLEEQREDALARLRGFRDAQLLVEGEYNDLEARIRQEHLDGLEKIEKRAQEQRRQAVSGALGDLSTLMQSENEKLFKIGKAAALADAIVNGYSAAVSAWEKGMKVGGPPVAAAFTAASLARTGALIGSISSASPSGGGGGASGAGGGAAGAVAATSEPSISRNVAIQLQGTTFNRDQVNDLITQINEAVEDGAFVRLV